ncbi:MAG: murein biosynthesis integral membrane protein MurJ [Planctomycetes bacterium]|nr:murein biosynthesis integral membrane protein MurJ [Planctomycetota bacterium]
MISGFRRIAGLTTISRVLGMARDAAFAHFFGANWLMTAWAMGFKIPNLARRLFGEGAASASFIPIYSEKLIENKAEAQKLACTMVTVIVALLSVVVLIGEVAVWAWYAFYETREGVRLGLALSGIMMPYMVLICCVAILSGILQVHRRFSAPAAAPIVLNLCIIAGTLLAGTLLDMPPEKQVFFVAVTVLIAGFAQIGLQVPSLLACGVFLRPAWHIHMPAFRRVFVLMGPMILGLTVTQLNTLLDDLIALAFMTREGVPLPFGAPSFLYYAQRLYQFPLGVLGISLATAIFPKMSDEAGRQDFEALKLTISQGLRVVLFVAMPATVGICLVARPLVSAIFEHGRFTAKDTPVVAWTLCFYALGLCGYFAQQICARAYYAVQDSSTPAKSAVLAVCINLVLNLSLIWVLGVKGLAAATAICSYLQVAFLIRGLRRRFGTGLLTGFKKTCVGTFCCSMVMGCVGWGLIWLLKGLPETFSSQCIRLAVIVPACGAAYMAMARVMRVEELSLLTARKGR